MSDAKKAAEFYQKAFGAEVRGIAQAPDGKVIHAEVKIGDSILMFNDEVPQMGVLAPTTTKASTCVTIHIYVEDADKVFAAAVAAERKWSCPCRTSSGAIATDPSRIRLATAGPSQLTSKTRAPKK